MRIAFCVFALLVSATSYAQAWQQGQARTIFDPKSGTRYNIQDNGPGGTIVRGFNYRTGSMWNTTIEDNGNQRGLDSNGNHWRYNAGSGNYQNFGTGEMCWGKGAFRSCSGGR